MDYSDAGKFKIASSTALGTLDRFVINGNGYVGIGTSTPARRLDVADSGNNNPQLRLSRETDVYADLSVAQTTGDLSLSLYRNERRRHFSLYAGRQHQRQLCGLRRGGLPERHQFYRRQLVRGRSDKICHQHDA